MSIAWENNPNGICEDAPCCGCCGPQGDGHIDEEQPYPDCPVCGEPIDYCLGHPGDEDEDEDDEYEDVDPLDWGADE